MIKKEDRNLNRKARHRRVRKKILEQQKDQD